MSTAPSHSNPLISRWFGHIVRLKKQPLWTEKEQKCGGSQNRNQAWKPVSFLLVSLLCKCQPNGTILRDLLVRQSGRPLSGVCAGGVQKAKTTRLSCSKWLGLEPRIGCSIIPWKSLPWGLWLGKEAQFFSCRVPWQDNKKSLLGTQIVWVNSAGCFLRFSKTVFGESYD